MAGSVDILMITYNRAAYTRLSLARLLETCDESARVWIWQNGCDPETMRVVSELRDHPRVHQYHHSEANLRLRDPTNWILSESDGEYVSKVDDDCLVPENWLDVLRKAHQDEPRFGAIGCWHFLPADFRENFAKKKIETFSQGHRIMRHPWIGGSGFLLKRACVARVGLLPPKESGITGYFLRIARAGWVNGWYFPFLYQDHMDDPRSQNTLIRSNDDLKKHLPLSAANFGADSLAAWDAQLRRSAVKLQAMPSDLRYYGPLRMSLRRRVQRWWPGFDDPTASILKGIS